MKIKYVIGIMVFLAISTLTGCGGGDNGAAPDPNAPASVTLTPSKNVALANGSDAITMQANVKKADGTAVADGTLVTFSVTGSTGAVLSSTSVACSGGIASVTVTHPAISGSSSQSIVVTAAADGVPGNMSVKFINQPSSVEVSIALRKSPASLAALQFTLNNTAGVTFNNNANPPAISPISAAAGSLITGNFVAANNSNTIGLINSSGFSPGITTPFIKATYSVSTGSGLPTFSVDAAATFIATDPVGNATVPQITAADLVVTTVFNTEL